MSSKLGYFPGCSLHATASEFDESLKAVFKTLNVELSEIKDWACCGATSGHATNHLLSIALPARILAQAEGEGHSEVLAPCAACFSRLATAHHEIAEDKELSEKVGKVLQRDFKNSVEVLNIVEFLKSQTSQIKEKVTKPLKGLKVACYYGCLLLRPPKVAKFDDAEVPIFFEEVVAATGATPIKWDMALECCGGGFSLARTGSVVRLGRKIIEDAKAKGADAVIVACPMCHSNLDLRQKAMTLRGKKPFDLPILFLTQLVGLSFGIDSEKLGLDRHFVNTDVILNVSEESPAVI